MLYRSATYICRETIHFSPFAPARKHSPFHFRLAFHRPPLLHSLQPNDLMTKAHYEMMAELRYSLRRFFRLSEEIALAAGATPQQYQSLLAIKGLPGRDQITIGELAEQLQIRHHSAVGLANRLVSEGYAQRVRGSTDRRQVFLALTPKGEALLEKLAATHGEEWMRIAPHLKTLLTKLRNQQARRRTH